MLTWLARNTDVITSRLLYSTSNRDRHVTRAVWTQRSDMFREDAWVRTADICFRRVNAQR